MTGLETVIGSRAGTAIQINGLFVPANSLTSRLAEFCEPAIFHNYGDVSYDYSKGGSLFKAHVGNRFFALTTAHQLSSAKYKYEQLSLFSNDGERIISSGRAVFPIEDGNHSGELDAVLFDFTESVLDGSLPKRNWFNLSGEMGRARTPKPLWAVAIGFPGRHNSIDYDSRSYAANVVAVTGLEASPSVSSRLAVRPKPSIQFDPLGMSGGPVFGFHVLSGVPELFFAGILTEASRAKLHFVSQQRIKNLIAAAD